MRNFKRFETKKFEAVAKLQNGSVIVEKCPTQHVAWQKAREWSVRGIEHKKDDGSGEILPPAMIHGIFVMEEDPERWKKPEEPHGTDVGNLSAAQ